MCHHLTTSTPCQCHPKDQQPCHHRLTTTLLPFIQNSNPSSPQPPLPPVAASPVAVLHGGSGDGGGGGGGGGGGDDEYDYELYTSDYSNSTFLRRYRHVFREVHAILGLAFPMILTGLLLYSRSMISMLFLGRLGELELAGGALAIGFANITGYSILSGLAMGMEPICGQAFGAKRTDLVGLTLQRTILLLLSASIPIAALWANMRKILLLCGQDQSISLSAHYYILCSLPDLLLQSLLHPLRIYLRTQSITMPLTYCAMYAIILHLPINYLLVSVLGLGIRGVALAGVWTNANLVSALLVYVYSSKVYRNTGGLKFTSESFKGWGTLLNLSIPSCVSVCLEWWWYEIIIILCGVLANPKATVASMGILIQITSLIYIFPSSLSFGVSTRVGNELGANRPKKARIATLVGIWCSFVFGFLALSFAVSVRNVWATLFTKDTHILKLTAAALPIIGLCELGNCPQTTGCGVLRGSARPKVGANINLSSFYAVGMPVAVLLGFWVKMDFVGLWIGLLAAQATCVVTMLTVILRTDWALQAQRAQNLITGAAVNDDDYPKNTIIKLVNKTQQQNLQPESTHTCDEETTNLLLQIKIEQPPIVVG
ncbi:MATE efflux family protein, expressed [Zostera marina]|uniref:Protein DETOXIFICATION n=1 Tax=Zostera marina TaxID=29655 RepID=A0A0K9PJU9_ZOSMR|nr:MATE efflux family protein, expressed [Zostera marina]